MWFQDLLFGTGVAHSILLLALTIALGINLSHIKFGSVSLGVTWVLFVGIIFSHFGFVIDPTTSHFVKEFGLILFIYSIGMEVGPSFFSSFKQGGLSLNFLAIAIIVLGSFTAWLIHLITGENLFAMIGVLYGAVTNTPGLGAAQQTFLDMTGESSSIFAQGYAVAYPLGVVGIILSIVVLRYIFKIDFKKEEELHKANVAKHNDEVEAATIEVDNPAVFDKTIGEVRKVLNRNVVATRLLHRQSGDLEMPSANTKIENGDRVYIVANPSDIDAIAMLLGRRVEDLDLTKVNDDAHSEIISRRIIVTKDNMQGRKLSELDIRRNFNVTISRVHRAGIDLVAHSNLQLQVGDRVTVVGGKESIKKVENLMGNTSKYLDEPQLFSTFFGIALGVLLGMIPIFLPKMPVPIKLGMAGGPLIVAILLSRFGPQLHLITYTTTSVKLLLRQMGICMFMAAVGLNAGVGFVDTIINGGYMWILYGFIITFLPCIIVGVIARLVFHRSYFSIMGLISGAMTDPPALAYSNSISGNDQTSVAYATVYPLSMFLRVLIAQILILIAL